MKRPQPDIAQVTLNKFINDMKTPRKLRRLWGTSIIDGVEVMDWRKLYYPEEARPENFDKLFKTLGIYEDVTNADMSGINDAWIYFNKNKSTASSVVLTPFVLDNLNKVRDDGLAGSYLSTKISIGTLRYDYDDYNESPIISRTMTEEQRITAILTNYQTLHDTCIIEHSGYATLTKVIPDLDGLGNSKYDDDDNLITKNVIEYLPADDPWVNAIAMNTLLDTNTSTSIKRCYKELIAIPRPKFGNSKQDREEDRYYTTRYRVRYVIELNIPLPSFSNSSNLVTTTVAQIQDDYSTYSPIEYTGGREGDIHYVAKPNGMVLKSLVQTDLDLIGSSTSEETVPVVLTNRDYDNWMDLATTLTSVYDSMWHKVGKYYYLKADVMYKPSIYGLKFSELNAYLEGILDSGYGKKSVPGWKKALAIVVFVVVVYFTRQAQWGTWAAAVIAGSLALTVISLALKELGEEEWAMAMAEANQMIEPLVMVANVYLLFTGISSAYDKAVQAAATEAGTTTADVTLAQVLGQMVSGSADGMLSTILEGARDVATGNIASNAAMQFTTTMFKVGNMVQQRRLEKLSDRIKDLASEYEDLTKEMSQERDILKGFARVYGKPATADWSIYAETYDLPYERGGGPLALGNVQRTTKQAIRKGTYNDPIFENMLVM